MYIVRKQQLELDMEQQTGSKLGEEYIMDVYCQPYLTYLNKLLFKLFNLYAEYSMRNSGLDEGKTGIKIARRNINNLRYADDTTLMAEREEH